MTDTVETVEDSLRNAMAEIEAKEAENEIESEDHSEKGKQEGLVSPENTKGDKPRDKSGKFQKEEKKEAAPQAEVKEQEPKKSKYEAPQSWKAQLKERWATLPEEFQEEISRRELDMHQAMTRHDGDLKMGRELKEVIAPYMPIIQAEGGTPAKAVQELLNTAYVLRTASPQVKAQMVQQIIQSYGVDMGLLGQQQQQQDPITQAIMQRLDGIENKFTEQTSLQEQSKFDNMVAEIKAFAARPENEHFEAIRQELAPYLSAAEAKNPNRAFQEILQEAYTAAIWANSTTRAALMQKQEAEAEAKRKEEVAKKKKAAASVTGSPGDNPPASPKSKKSLHDELSETYDRLVG